jgi:hypothetical protein
MLDIIHRPVFYLKHDVSEAGFCLCNLLVWAQRLELVCLRTPRGFMRPTQQKPPKRVNISTPWISVHVGPTSGTVPSAFRCVPPYGLCWQSNTNLFSNKPIYYLCISVWFYLISASCFDPCFRITFRVSHRYASRYCVS